MAFIYVRFAFVNKKGEKKSVRFPMDERSYEAYHDPSVPKEWTDMMMLQEYHEYCDERKHRRKFVQIPVGKDGNEIEIPDPSPSIVEVLIQREEAEMRRSAMSSILKKLPPRQREAFILVHQEGMRSIDAARKMGISKSTFSEHLHKAEEAVERIIEKKIF